ncbi:MAG: sigma-70 family RNA polymerase sigma factor [Williamsia sp.]|nr:sigma-70 family RNA polymerase sigma factor [Williamsia sp.]
MQTHELIPHLFKTEYRKIISVLCKLFGIEYIEIAEDITSDTFLLAAETWGLKGIPDHPTAWLYTVAKNKTKDYLKRNTLFTEKIKNNIRRSQPVTCEIEIDLSKKNIHDSQLQMIFAVCNPIIPPEAQTSLALHILCGFGVEEIAEAFLTSKEAIYKRLLRAKEKIRAAASKIEIPGPADIQQRLETVLTTIYLLFNEGYYSKTQNVTLRKDFCIEAMRLTQLLLQHENTNKPSVNALMSLMCFHASRFDARLSHKGETILYEEQDRTLWNDDLIAEGNHYLIESAKGQTLSKYHLEASIAYWHCTKTEPANKWEQILQLYNQLLQIEYSSVTALNRTYALSKVYGKEVAIEEARKLKLAGNHLYFCLLGYLYMDNNASMAIECFEQALALSKTVNDKKIIKGYLLQLSRKC